MVTKYPPSKYPETTERQSLGVTIADHKTVTIIDHRGVSPYSDSPTHQIRPEAASRSRYRPTGRNQNRDAVEGVEETTGASGGDYKGYYEDDEGEEEDGADVDVEYRYEYSNNTPSSTRSSRPTANSRRYHQSQAQAQSQSQLHAQSQLQSQPHGTIREEEHSHSSQPQQLPPQRTAVNEYEYYAANGGGYHPMAIQPSSQLSLSQGAPSDNGLIHRPYTDRPYTDNSPYADSSLYPDNSPYADNNPYSDGMPYGGMSRQDSDMTSPGREMIMSTHYLHNSPLASNSQQQMHQLFGENVREHSIHSLDADGMVQWYQGNPIPL